MSKTRRIRDPLHGLIEFKAGGLEAACWKIIQTEPFQRLRRVKQLGFSEFVYPGASHTRLSHSLGVFHTARLLADHLTEIVHVDRVNSPARCAAISAALVHDIGHGPFSHAFEEALHEQGVMWSHEDMSERLIRETQIREIFEDWELGSTDRIVGMIKGQQQDTFYHAIVSSQFDADRLDYMQRDRLMTGRKGSGIDFQWLLGNLDLRRIPIFQDGEKQGEIETLVFGKKAIQAADAYVLGLFQLYQAVYLHKTTRGLEKVFSAIISRLTKLVQDEVSVGLPDSNPLLSFISNPKSLEAFLRLDDSAVMSTLHALKSSEDIVLSELSRGITDRKIYKAVDLTQRVSAFLLSANPNIKLDMGHTDYLNKVRATEVAVLERLESKLPNKKDELPTYLVDVAKRNPYKVGGGGFPFQTIYGVSQNDEVLELTKLSPVVAALKPFYARRVYFRNESDKSLIDDLVKECANVR